MADAIHQYVAEALGQELPLWAGAYLFVSAIVASAAAFFGSYLRRRGEQQALNADFETALSQLKQQTKATETIKTALGAELER